MATTTFYVGEQPSEPLVITVRDAAGAPVDLDPVTDVFIVGDELPEGVASILNEVEGKVQYTFTGPFEDAGILTLQVQLIFTNGGVDYSAPFTISVLDPADDLATIVTPAQVESWTGVSVSQSSVVAAQGVVMLVVGRNLTDELWLASIGDQDRFWLNQAVAWQSAENPGGDTVPVAMPYIPGASSIKNGDVAVTYRDGAVNELTNLAANARLAIKKISWMRPVRSMTAAPFLSRRGLTDQEWYDFVYLLPGGHR